MAEELKVETSGRSARVTLPEDNTVHVIINGVDVRINSYSVAIYDKDGWQLAQVFLPRNK